MKFFTLDAYNAWYRDVDDCPLGLAFKAYNLHLEAMRGVLPANVLSLTELPGVDDGLVVSAHLHRKRQALILVLRCSNLQMGCYDLVLTYEGVMLSFQDEQTLAHVARTTRDEHHAESELAYHEVEQANDGGIEHRLLFHPGLWFTIGCQTLCWHTVARPNRHLPHLPNRFSNQPD